MLRELQTIINKNADSMLKADVDVVTGMGVVKDGSNGEFKLPTAETDTGVFFVNKEQVPTGLNTARINMSDYDDDFCKVAAGERAKLIAYVAGERIATDQYSDSLTDIDTYVKVGTDGKIAAVASGTSKMLFKGTMIDNGHTLAIIEFVG